MSRGQKRRVPANFPRMRYRARKRHLWRIQCGYGVVLLRRWDATEPGGWVPIARLAAWELPADDLLDPSAWLEVTPDV